VDTHQIHDMFCSDELKQDYDVIHYTHPKREAQDGVAILWKKGRFELLESEMVPFHAKQEEYQYYMCAAVAHVMDNVTQKRLLLACIHFYDKKCIKPQETLLQYILSKKEEKADGIIWGGDCNHEYKSILPDGFSTPASSCARNEENGSWVYPTSNSKKIDWIFYSSSNGCEEEETVLSSFTSLESEAFVKSTAEAFDCMGGYTLSDHLGEATTFIFS